MSNKDKAKMWFTVGMGAFVVGSTSQYYDLEYLHIIAGGVGILLFLYFNNKK